MLIPSRFEGGRASLRASVGVVEAGILVNILLWIDTVFVGVLSTPARKGYSFLIGVMEFDI